jgi:antitoxin (DNA-binding transcriptional repressor) of toxin-antitoxin stability system
MTATLQEIHLNREILDQAIAAKETLEILAHGEPAATLVPIVRFSQDEARKAMARMFANPEWRFSVGTPMNREERNSRG